MHFNFLVLHKPFLFLFCCFFLAKAPAQLFTEKKYPQGYFIYPVGANAIALAANFGELRPDHFHMGLDCKTDHRENVPVFAAADGYVARVKIEPFGFGRAIYINHPNGYTTLYAHLNEFYAELEAYVKKEQYRLQSWQVFLDIPKGMFNVKQRQVIAHSGNTGGSQGPHTHFEIRDTKTDKNLNPLLFGFPIADRVAPSIQSIALYNRDVSTYSQRPNIISVIKKGGVYQPAVRLIKTKLDRVSVGITGFDQLSGSPNHIGIFEGILYVDDKVVTGFRMDQISYDDTRYLNAHIDYKTKMSGGAYIQHLSRLPGNPVFPEGIYKDASGDGVIDLSDHNMHVVKVVVKDAAGNSSVVSFELQHEGVSKPVANNNNEGDGGIEFEPNLKNIFDNGDVEVLTDERAVYDSFQLKVVTSTPTFAPSASLVYSIASGLIPLHTYAKIRIKPGMQISGVDGNRILMERSWKNKTEVVKAVKEGEKYGAMFRNFGDFRLVVDKEPPTITVSFGDGAVLTGKPFIIINVKDNFETVKHFRAEMDGKWIRFTNDKEKAFIYKFDEMCGPGAHKLHISVEDEAGNVSTKTLNFTR